MDHGLLGFVTHGIAGAMGGVHACVGGWWVGRVARERTRTPFTPSPHPCDACTSPFSPATHHSHKHQASPMFPFRRGTHPPHITAPHASAPLPVFILRPLSIRGLWPSFHPPTLPRHTGSCLVLVLVCLGLYHKKPFRASSWPLPPPSRPPPWPRPPPRAPPPSCCLLLLGMRGARG